MTPPREGTFGRAAGQPLPWLGGASGCRGGALAGAVASVAYSTRFQ